MELVKFFLPFGVVLLLWVVISQVLAHLVAYDRSEDGILSMWVCIFLAPILILYVLLSWLQMKSKLALYANIQIMTLGTAPMREPSHDLRDYIP